MAGATTSRRWDDSTALGRVRILHHRDLAEAIRILSLNPIENVFVASRIRAAGLGAAALGCPIWGYEEDGRLQALCHSGSNLVPVNANAEAVAAFAEFAGSQRMCSSIIGPAEVALQLWHQLSQRWGTSWSQVREVRPRQPVMAIDSQPRVSADPAVQRISLDLWDAYYDAAVKMYTEEVGVSPVQGNSAGYRYYVRQLISQGRAFGIVRDGRVIFKADLGSVSGSVCQVQGVWLDPELRGHGRAAAAMAAVVEQARVLTPIVSLYVNDFNLPARATYAKVGFADVGEFATVLY